MSNKLSILLIDDDQINNFVSESIIRKSAIDCQVKICLNGQEGIQALRQNQPADLILVDINMPVMDGLEFLENASTLAGIHQKAIYLMHTSPLTPGQKERLSKVHLTGSFLKPLSKEKLEKLLQENFSGKRI